MEDIAYTTTFRRSHHAYRLPVVAKSREDLCERLRSYAQDDAISGVFSVQAEFKTPRIVFVYTGMGPQWWAMGRELLQRVPLFYESVAECDEIFRLYAGWSVLDELNAGEHLSNMAQTRVAQPYNVVLQVALTRLWESWGIVPDAVVGHSVGEITAACISGALSLRDALLLSYHRSRLQQTTAAQGGPILRVVCC